MAAMEMAAKQAAATIKNSAKKPMMFFGGHGTGFPKAMRVVASVTAAAMAWLGGPVNAFAKKPVPITPYSRLTEKHLTQTPDAALQAKIAGSKVAADAAKKNAPTPDVRPLSKTELLTLRGSGPNRNAYFNGSLPWQRSLRDVNLVNGNLFKSFTDIQIAPGRGAGLVLQRTYNSNDDRIGPFGVGWTHAYDIRMEEAGVDPTTEAETVPRTDFFGGKHDYKRDADGLYSPPAYMFDEMDSKYDEQLANGPTQPLEDTQKGMDGTVKHFVTNETLAGGGINHNVRVCDYIEDRHGNRTNLAYNTTITLPDGSTKKLLTSVTDPVGRSLTFTWANLGTTSQPAYRITQVDGPSGTYSVTYSYNSELNLSAVHLDANGLNRTTTFGYTSYAGETGLLASITDPLGHSVSYAYGDKLYTDQQYAYTYLVQPSSLAVTEINEPGDSGARNIWRVRFLNNLTFVYFNKPLPDATNYYPAETPNVTVIYDLYGRVTNTSTKAGGRLFDNFVFYPMFTNVYDTSNNVVEQGQWDVPFTHDWVAIRSTSTYGPHGNVLTQQMVGYPGVTTTHYYNASKYFQKASVTDALGHVSNFDYYDDQDTSLGNRGEVKWVRDARYSTTGKQFEYSYNQYGQKVSEKNLNDVVTAYTYGDTWGNLTQVVQDPSDAGANYVGLNRTTQMSYDVAGRVLSSIDPMSHTSTFGYNALGQPTQASFAATASTPAETITYGYGANGRTQTVTDGRGTTAITYQTDGDRVASVTDPLTGTISQTYTDWGARASVTLPDGSTRTYAYDEHMILPKDDANSVTARPTQMTDESNRVVSFDINDFGSLMKMRFNQNFGGGGQSASYEEAVSRQQGLPLPDGYFTTQYGRPLLARLKTTWSGADGSGQAVTRVMNQSDYSYDANGQHTTHKITASDASNSLVSRTEQYGYDALSRLTSVNYGDSGTANVQTYSFDAMGNRTAKTDNVTGNETYGFNNANMLTSRSANGSGSTYTSDANGNTLSGGGGSIRGTARTGWSRWSRAA